MRKTYRSKWHFNHLLTLSHCYSFYSVEHDPYQILINVIKYRIIYMYNLSKYIIKKCVFTGQLPESFEWRQHLSNKKVSNNLTSFSQQGVVASNDFLMWLTPSRSLLGDGPIYLFAIDGEIISGGTLKFGLLTYFFKSIVPLMR